MPRIVTLTSVLWPRLRAAITSGLHWWWTELSEPFSPLARRLGQRKERVFLTVVAADEPGAPLTLSAMADMTLPLSANRPADWKVSCAGRTAFVTLASSQVFQLPIQLPHAAISRSRDAVKYQLIAESPVPPELILFDVRKPPRPKTPTRLKNTHISVDVALCRRSTVEALSETLEAAGVSKSVIGFSKDGDERLDFVFMTSRGAKKAHAMHRMNRLLASCAVVICLSAFPITFATARWLSVQTQEEIEAARNSRSGVIPLYERQALIRAIQHDLTTQVALPPLSLVMNSLATNLPPDSWLHLVRYDRGTLSLQGFSSDPTAVVKLLEQAPTLGSVKLNTVTAANLEPNLALAQFELSAAIRSGRPR